MGGERGYIQLRFGGFENLEEEENSGSVVIHDRQDWHPPFVTIRGRTGVNQLIMEESRIAKKLRQKRAEQKIEPGGADFDPFPKLDEITDNHKKMADKTRKRINWKSEVYP